MSEFDPEKERERLREQYERDKQKREASEKMSELLLQGATMTNAHCSDCSNPIFRYDGQEFCANCEKAVNREQGEGGGSAVEVTKPDDETQVVFGGQTEQPAAETGQQKEESVDSQSQRTARDQQGPQNLPQEATDSSIEVPQETRPQTHQGTPPQPRTEQPQQSAGTAADADLSTARDALVRALVQCSKEAAAAEDPRRAKEHLEAAHEAAATLSTLDK